MTKIVKSAIMLFIFIAVILLVVIFYFYFKQKLNPPITEVKVDTNTLISNTVNDFEKITNLKPGDDEQMAIQASGVIDRGDESIDPLIEQISNPDFKVRWLSIYSLALMSHKNASPESIQKIIIAFQKAIPNETNISLKIQMETLLISLGQKEQFPMVINCLNEKGFVLFSYPQKKIKDFCFETLKYYLDKDFQYNISEWQNWWQKNQNNIFWNQAGQKFIVR